METRPFQVCLICSFCSSDRGFAHRELFIPQSGFLQISLHGEHPCLRLMLPTTKRIADFHRQVIAHAGRTRKSTQQVFYLLSALETVPEIAVRSAILFSGGISPSPSFHDRIGLIFPFGSVCISHPVSPYPCLRSAQAPYRYTPPRTHSRPVPRLRSR